MEAPAKRPRRRRPPQATELPPGARDEGSEAYAWHFDMLHDGARLAAFGEAFGRLPAASSRGLAVDIGCGSGVLGLALLRRQPRLQHVHGIECEASVAAVARDNVKRAGEERRMSVHACRSTSLQGLPGPAGSAGAAARASLVVAEILDAGLLGEDCLGTLRHAADRLLEPGYHAVPASAELFAVAVESSVLASWQHCTPRAWMPTDYVRDHGDANPHDVALDRLVEAGGARVLSEEFYAFHFDFESLPPAAGRCQVCEVRVARAGRVDAVVFWWRCRMVRGDAEAAMTNAPPWAPSASHLPPRSEIDHWRQSVCVLPRPAAQVAAGGVLRVAVLHNDEDVWFRVLGADGETPPSPALVPRAASNMSLWSQARLWSLADDAGHQLLEGAVRQAVRAAPLRPWREHAGVLVVDLSDGPLASVAALSALAELARERRRQRRRGPASRRLRAALWLSGRRPTVLCLESSAQDLQVARDVAAPYAARLRRRLARTTRRGGAPALQLSTELPMLVPGSVSALCGEPHLRACEGLPCDSQLWQHWAQVDSLRWTLAPAAALVPCRFRVWAALVSCPGLWRRRQPVGAPVCGGVDVAAINRLHPESGADGAAFRHRFPCGLWQVEHSIRGEPAALCEVHLSEPFPERVRLFPEVTFQPRPSPRVSTPWSRGRRWSSRRAGGTPAQRRQRRRWAAGSRGCRPRQRRRGCCWPAGRCRQRRPRAARYCACAPASTPATGR
ncbi:unnamed protein product [Prorocentrum cordatum]|uniref:Protein arginine N-methyltransferase n=1 Tax=Prorocentrum cordatum TaxID=2364126 RepID=A0ABN9WB04_9DINO|nr:unnamed protein product [Polarella glacialis]